jgi:hypothetical protein
MRKRDKAEYWALGGVLHLVETQTAKRAGLTVLRLRVLVRLAALTADGALVRSVDVSRALGLGNEIRTSGALSYMDRKSRHVALQGGRNGTGTYSLTKLGREVAQDYASAWRRAAGSFTAFEEVKPYNRLTPLK